MRDVYKKFLHSKTSSDTYSAARSVPLPFFYVRNNNFCALFMRDNENKPTCILDPSKNLVSIINERIYKNSYRTYITTKRNSKRRKRKEGRRSLNNSCKKRR